MNVTIILLTGVLACCGYVSHAGKDRIITTEASVRCLSTVVKEFKRACNRLPTEEEGLQALVRKPADWPDGVPWESLLDVTDIPRDGWGNEFVYVLTPESAEGFGIYSCGADGVTTSGGNDQDDLNTWNAERPWRQHYARRSRWLEVTPSGAAAATIIVLVIAGAAGFLWRAARTGTPPGQ